VVVENREGVDFPEEVQNLMEEVDYRAEAVVE
jgi:hypothetical protein